MSHSKRGKSTKAHPTIKPIKDDVDISVDALTQYAEEHPVFSFEHLCENFLRPSKESPDFFQDFVKRLHKLGELGWKQIRTSDRHSFGMEKIPVAQMFPQMPCCVTEDVTELSVFRADGANRVFAGFMRDKIFFVLFIESNFGDLYNH